MEQHPYKYIYGPVSSWRIGKSLGIDPISSDEKTCSFDCVYCQAGRTECLTSERKVFVPTQEIVAEVRKFPAVGVDYITFAGNGEPTLAKNLGEMIREIRKVRSEKIAVITNASIIDRNDVREDLALADLVVAKLDSSSNDSLKAVNRPASDIVFEDILQGLISFGKLFKGKLELQIMFVKANKALAREIAKEAFRIEPDEIEINTPLRVCAVKPLEPEEIAEITDIFREVCVNVPVKSVYEAERQKSNPFCQQSTERRRGKEIH